MPYKYFYYPFGTSGDLATGHRRRIKGYLGRQRRRDSQCPDIYAHDRHHGSAVLDHKLHPETVRPG